MTDDERARALAAAWEDIRQGLGELGQGLDHARAWVGDRAFLALCQDFDPGEIIVACGIADAAELLEGYGPARRGHLRMAATEGRLEAAIATAHAACGPHPARSAEEKAAARKALDDLIRRDRKRPS